MKNEAQDAGRAKRIYWLDNLRTFAIFLVIVIHAGIVYESSGIGAIFWIVDDPSTNDLIGIVNLILDIFVMATIFFISGYLTLQSLKDKTRWEFVKTRFRRLMVPWAIAVFTLIPIYKVFFLYSRGLAQENWTTYFHFSNGIWGMNWLWFLPVLFLFNLLYVLLSSRNWVPEKMSFKQGVLATFTISLAFSVAFDVLGANGWTKTLLIDFQNERLLIYFLIFLLGSLGYRQGVFTPRPESKRLFFAVNATAWIPMSVYVVLVIFYLLNPSFVMVSPLVDSLVLRFSFCLSLLALMYAMIETFRFFLDRPGRLWGELNKSSYPVYIIHVIVLGGIALALLVTTLPALLKYSILAVATFAASNLIVLLTRRALGTIGIGKWLQQRVASRGAAAVRIRTL